MIIIKLKGGFGNQLFILNFYFGLLKIRDDVYLDLSFYNSQDKLFERIKRFFTKTPSRKIINITNDIKIFQPNINVDQDGFSSFIRQIIGWEKYMVFFSGYTIYTDNDLIDINNKNMILDGYWQFNTFFNKNISDLNYYIKSSYKFHTRTFEVVLHVRRGDQVNNVFNSNYSELTLDFYKNALELLSKRFSLGKIDCFVCSDDINWCKNVFIDYNDVRFVFSDEKNLIDDFVYMYNSKFLISSNSTFSYMAGLLGHSDFMIVPRLWYNGSKPLFTYHCEKSILL